MTQHDAMTSRQRVMAAIAGEAVDRVPVSLWRHFPENDQTVADLVTATLAWQRRHGFDVVKFMPPGDYPIIDWGGVTVYAGALGGTRTTVRFPVSAPEDWRSLRPVDVTAGFNAVVRDALAATRAQLEPDVPLLHTVFSPLTIAMKLSGGRAGEHLRIHPEALHQALSVIRDVTRSVVAATAGAGADGFFFATQCADLAVMTEAEYREFGLPYDLAVLGAVTTPSIILLHLHGAQPMFALHAEYPAQIVNWHDRHAEPSLADGQRHSGRCVAGGIDERQIARRTAEDVAVEAADAIAQTQGRSHLLTPGCVIPIDTPPENVDAVVATAKRGAP